MKDVKAKDDRRKILLVGPPGCGALGWARAFRTECKHFQGREGEQSYVCRVAQLEVPADERALPARLPCSGFRAPHHSVSIQGMMGTLRGHIWRPGELALAHGGVLYLDEAPEFRNEVLMSVAGAFNRASLTMISGDYQRLEVPTYFSLVMYAQPCPCGWYGYRDRECQCGEGQRVRYLDRLAYLMQGDVERIDLPAREAVSS